MKKQLRFVFAVSAVLSITEANAGFFDSIKTIGADVSALAESAADSVVAASTNALNSVKEQTSQIVDQTNGFITIQSRQTVVADTTRAAISEGGSQSGGQEELQPQVKVGKQAYSTEGGQNRNTAEDIQSGKSAQQRLGVPQQRYRNTDFPQRQVGRGDPRQKTVAVDATMAVVSEHGSESVGRKALQSQVDVGKQTYSTEVGQNRIAAEDVQSGKSAQQRLGAPQQRNRNTDFPQRQLGMRNHRQVKIGQGNSVEYADEKTSEAYGEVWKSFETKTTLINDLKKRLNDDVDYQLKQVYEISPKDKYEVIRVKSEVIQFSGVNSGLKSRLMREGCLCPKSASDFNAWTNAMFSVIDADICKLKTTIMRRIKFYEFLNQWAKMQADYSKLLSLFDIVDVELLTADMDGDVDLVGEVEGCSIRRDFYPVLRKHFNTGNFKFAFKCPRTDAALESWIGKVSKQYESKSAEYRARIDEVEKELHAFKSFASVLRDKNGSFADIGALSIADPVKFDELSGRMMDLVDKGKLMPLEIKPYLSNEQLKGKLEALVKSMDEISKVAAATMKEFEQQGIASDALYAEWHRDISLTNVPGVAGVGLGSSLYLASKKLLPNVARVCVFAEQDASYRGQCSYSFNSISQFPALENIYYEFGGNSKIQGLCFVKGGYSFKDEMPYKDVVASYHKRMPQQPNEIVEKKIVGHDINELRSRSRWAAWQVDYYTRRTENTTQDMQKKQIAAKDDIIRRYRARPLIVSTTTLKAAGYEVQIISDVNEVNAKSVLMKDDIALLKLKRLADSK